MNKLLLSIALSSLFFVFCRDSKTDLNKAEHPEYDMTSTATIVKNKETKTTSLDVTTDGKWSLFAGISVDEIDFSKPIEVGEGSGTFSLEVSDSVRHYFGLVTEKGKIILSERHLPMAGGYNFRDLGGIKTSGNRFVKWGKMFRSDDLNNLTEQDLKYLANIPLISIVDFRSADEIIAAPDKLPASVKKDYQLSITPGDILSAIDFDGSSTIAIDSVMMQMNRSLVTDTACINQYKKFFELVQNEKDVPLMFHCSAGKDRTGMGAALFLFALGVDENTIMDDYLASNIYMADKYAKYIAENPNLKPLFEVKREFLMSGIDQIRKDHGTIENYLVKVLNVDIVKIKEMYLY